MLLFKSLNSGILACCSQLEPCVDFAHLHLSSCFSPTILSPWTYFIQFPSQLPPASLRCSDHHLPPNYVVSDHSINNWSDRPSWYISLGQPHLGFATQVQVSFLPLQTLDPTKLRDGVSHELNLSIQRASLQSLSLQLFSSFQSLFQRGALRRNSFP